jgi:hypothetical protein
MAEVPTINAAQQYRCDSQVAKSLGLALPQALQQATLAFSAAIKAELQRLRSSSCSDVSVADRCYMLATMQRQQLPASSAAARGCTPYGTHTYLLVAARNCRISTQYVRCLSCLQIETDPTTVSDDSIGADNCRALQDTCQALQEFCQALISNKLINDLRPPLQQARLGACHANNLDCRK